MNNLKSILKNLSFLQKLPCTEVNKICHRNFTPRRALMYVPGDDLKKINKAFTLQVDCIVLDCEDGVAMNRKKEARELIKCVLDKGKIQKKTNYDLGVRINSVDSGLCENDLSIILSARHLPDTILLPKIDEIDQLKWFSEKINSLIMRKQKINLIMYIESAKSMINLKEICTCAFELSSSSKFIPTSLVFGSDDLCASIGVTRSEDDNEILYARQKLVLYAKAFNLQAIDMVYIYYKDLYGLKEQCEQGAKFGYSGKQVIHPGQIDIVQTAFLPNKRQLEWALKVLEEFHSHQKSGKGAFNYNGSMIDMPTMRQAQNIVDLLNTVKKS